MGASIVRVYVLVVFIAAAGAACSGPADTAPPVATATVSPARADVPAGSPVDVRYRFVVAADAPAFTGDEVVFVHAYDANHERLWTDDHQPDPPTRQWKPGQTIDYSRIMFVPKVAYQGDVSLEIGLYTPRTGARLPLSGQSTGMRSYPSATMNVVLPSNTTFVVFTDGWYDPEVAEDGLEWQWSKRQGTVSFRNPGKAATLFLQLDQPATPFTEPQRVEVRSGAAVVDSFALPSGRRELRRIPLSPEQLGPGDTTALTIAVDRTFVPAALPSLGSSDARELGVRVFRVHVEAP